MMASAAPVVSCRIAKRPMPGMSVGASSVRPPSLFAFAALDRNTDASGYVWMALCLAFGGLFLLTGRGLWTLKSWGRVMAIVNFAILRLGFGLVPLVAAVSTVRFASCAAYTLNAFHVCPSLRLSPSCVRRETSRG